jgi:phosphopantetheinyl transferase
VSLSHRLGWVASAVAAPGLGPIGVDVECERAPRSDVDERAALMLADDERLCWHRLDPAGREAGLLVRWTAKEAWYKAAPAAAGAWDFRRVVARACEPACANVRVWHAGAVVLALCCNDAQALANAICVGLPEGAPQTVTSWHVARVA